MITNFIEETLENKSLTDKEKIDVMLEWDATMYCNLGTESTKGERDMVKRQSKTIYRAIKKLDDKLGTLLINAET